MALARLLQPNAPDKMQTADFTPYAATLLFGKKTYMSSLTLA